MLSGVANAGSKVSLGKFLSDGQIPGSANTSCRGVVSNKGICPSGDVGDEVNASRTNKLTQPKSHGDHYQSAGEH